MWNGEPYLAFLPEPLPPADEIPISGGLQRLIDQAHVALGRLDVVSGFLTDPYLFLYTYVRKEALLSSQIEGTQSTLSELLLFEIDEAPGAPNDDVIEVSNYAKAIAFGLEAVRRDEGFTIPWLQELHRILLTSGRGAAKSPGALRLDQNWIGGRTPLDARYVPPPNRDVPRLLNNLLEYVRDPEKSASALVRAALAHVQFETIHPFHDGNGRLGRILTPLILCADGILNEPILYLSLYLKRRREEYYGLLQKVRTEGAWDEWLGFFAEGVRVSADSAVDTAKRLLAQAERDRKTVAETCGRQSGSALRLLDALTRRPLLSPSIAAANAGLAPSTVNNGFRALEGAGLVREITGRRRDRVYAYSPYLAILAEGTEP